MVFVKMGIFVEEVLAGAQRSNHRIESSRFGRERRGRNCPRKDEDI